MQSFNVARTAWLTAGLPLTVAATTVDTQCGSSQQATNLATSLIASGVVDVAVACGVEDMSQVPMGSNSAKGWASARPSPRATSTSTSSPRQFEGAERIADKWGITRADADEFGLRSQQLAAQAWAEDRFATQIVERRRPRPRRRAASPPAPPTGSSRDEGLRDTTPRGARRAQARRPRGRRAHRRHLVADLRRRRRGAGDDPREGRRSSASRPWPGWSTPASSGSIRCSCSPVPSTPPSTCSAATACPCPTSTSSRSTRPSPRSCSAGQRELGADMERRQPQRRRHRPRPPPRRHRRHPDSPRPCTSSTGPTRHRPSSPCAAVAASAPAPSSSGSELLAPRGSGRRTRSAPTGGARHVVEIPCPARRARARVVGLACLPGEALAPRGAADRGAGRRPAVDRRGRRRHHRGRARRPPTRRSASSASTRPRPSTRPSRSSASARRRPSTPPSCCRPAPRSGSSATTRSATTTAGCSPTSTARSDDLFVNLALVQQGYADAAHRSAPTWPTCADLAAADAAARPSATSGCGARAAGRGPTGRLRR